MALERRKVVEMPFGADYQAGGMVQFLRLEYSVETRCRGEDVGCEKVVGGYLYSVDKEIVDSYYYFVDLDYYFRRRKYPSFRPSVKKIYKGSLDLAFNLHIAVE